VPLKSLFIFYRRSTGKTTTIRHVKRLGIWNPPPPTL
jgi:hypothetical protein